MYLGKFPFDFQSCPLTIGKLISYHSLNIALKAMIVYMIDIYEYFGYLSSQYKYLKTKTFSENPIHHHDSSLPP